MDNDCVFCTNEDNPEPLFETRSLYAMPDKFPLVPGHTLIISKEHLPCYGAAGIELLHELDEVAATVRRFLREAYGAPVLAWENGVSGQSVFHAHLHAIPLSPDALPSEVLPPEVAEHADVAPIADWDAVRGHYARHSCYRYLEVAGRRHLFPGYSKALGPVTAWLARLTGLQYAPSG